MRGFGIDLGTANTVVGEPERGIVLNEPSVMLTRRTDPYRAVLVGSKARELIGRTPDGYETVRPLRDGVIVDLESLWQASRAAFVAGVAIVLVFSLAVFGVARFADYSRDRRPVAAALSGALAAIALATTAAAITLGIIVIAR
jgi:actin-like ATPase involved in cell morphogenesis